MPRWSPQEQEKFVQAIRCFGRDMKKIKENMQSSRSLSSLNHEAIKLRKQLENDPTDPNFDLLEILQAGIKK